MNRASAVSQSLRSAVPLPVPSAAVKRAARGLVAHVGAVGQVVGAELARHQLVEEGRLRCPAVPTCRRRPGSGSSSPRSSRPTSSKASCQVMGSIVVGGRVVDHRLGQPALVFQGEVGPARQLGNTCAAAKNSRPTRLWVISHVTCLMPFSQMSSCRPLVSSGHAQPGQSNPPSSWFILWMARAPVQHGVLAGQDLGDAHGRAPPGGGVVIRMV